MLILDTNILLDLHVFQDLAVQPIRAALQSPVWQWIATPAMRDELARVLTYAHIAPRLQLASTSAQAILDAFDQQVTLREPAPKAPLTCKDPDDQIFIDLAVAHHAILISKDKRVLALQKRVQLLCGRPLIMLPADFPG